jgi:hypothetical protein
MLCCLGQLGEHEIIENLIRMHWNILGTPKSFKMSNCPPPLTHSVFFFFFLGGEFLPLSKQKGASNINKNFFEKKIQISLNFEFFNIIISRFPQQLLRGSQDIKGFQKLDTFICGL